MIEARRADRRRGRFERPPELLHQREVPLGVEGEGRAAAEVRLCGVGEGGELLSSEVEAVEGEGERDGRLGGVWV